MNKIFILDTSALLSVQQVLTFFVENSSDSKTLFFTTESIMDEIKDQMSKLRIESMVASETLFVKDIDEKYKLQIDQHCLQIGNSKRLSEQDKTVLSLALQVKDKNPQSEVFVLSDDYEIQNTAKIMHIKFKAIRTKGITYSATFKKICQACGEKVLEEETYCPECGSTKIRRFKSSYTKKKSNK